ncbi:MAG: phenylacetate--CoA ligase family protein [Alphaproteobacteria bacterium]|nr:phenylacetate--CoA ligase family protein [Alphaproteobacteria bacterium]
MDASYDALETRAPAAREAALFSALGTQVAHAKAAAPYFAESLQGVAPADVEDRAGLARLPVTRKSDLVRLQAERPPFGGLAALPAGKLRRVFVSPGPIFDPEGQRADDWGFARALFAAGFRGGQLCHNTFSYHLTPAGAMLEEGCRALGCAVIPAGIGATEQQVEVIARLRPDGYTGTPSFLKILLARGREVGADLSSLRHALVSAEALPPALRAELESFGPRVLQCYASADLGLIAYESPARDGMIVTEDVILEIVRPGTGDPVPEGEVGEVVVTTLRPDYPLIRFATGDLSAVLPGASPCGRTNLRIKGWMGRADQTTKVRGMFVHPHQVALVLRRHPEVARARLVVDNPGGADRMTLRCEVAGAAAGLPERIAATLREACNLRGEVELVGPGVLPNDGKVIDDQRRHG